MKLRYYVYAIVTVILLAFLFGCTSTKNVHRTTHDSLAVSQLKSDLKINDKSKTETLTETTEVSQLDTNKVIPGSTLKGSTTAEALKGNPLVLEDGNQEVILSEDSTGKYSILAKVKPKTVDFKFNKTIKTTEKKAEAQSSSADIKTNDKKKVEVSVSDTVKNKKTTLNIPVEVYFWLIVIVMIAGVVWAIKKKIIKSPFSI